MRSWHKAHIGRHFIFQLGINFFKGDLIRKMKKKKKKSFEPLSNIILNPNDQNNILHAKIELIEIKRSCHIKFQVMRDILGLSYT